MKLKELIEAVRAIDENAAEYLEHEAPKLNSYGSGEGDVFNAFPLDSIMAWSETPQGHDYWRNIRNLLGE